jgi:hypothetical protein
MDRVPGTALMVTGIGHALLGLVLFRAPLAAIVHDGIANSIRHGQFERAAAFWFLIFSPACFLLGLLANHAVARRDRWLGAVVGWNLVAIGGVGALVMPVSGFWILVVLAPFVFKAVRGLDDPGAHPAAGGGRAGRVP